MREHATHGPGLLARLLIGGVDHLPWPAELLLLGARIYAGYTIASAGLDKLPVPSSFNNWDLTTHPLERQADRTWSATFVLGEPGPITFKFAANGSWDVKLGDDDPGTAGFPVAGTGELGGENIEAYIAAEDTVRFTVNPDSRTYRVEPVEGGANESVFP